MHGFAHTEFELADEIGAQRENTIAKNVCSEWLRFVENFARGIEEMEP